MQLVSSPAASAFFAPFTASRASGLATGAAPAPAAGATALSASVVEPPPPRNCVTVAISLLQGPASAGAATEMKLAAINIAIDFMLFLHCTLAGTKNQ